jgi:hypothetical protein
LESQAKYGQWLTIVTARFVSPTESIGENQSHVNSRICRSRWLEHTIVIGYSRHSNKGRLWHFTMVRIFYMSRVLKWQPKESVQQSNTDNSWGGRICSTITYWDIKSLIPLRNRTKVLPFWSLSLLDWIHHRSRKNEQTHKFILESIPLGSILSWIDSSGNE